MNKNNIIKRAFLDAFGIFVYVSIFAFVVNNLDKWIKIKPNGWLGAAFFLCMFIVSACITGSLMLLKPLLLYLEGQKKEAVNLFLYTIGFLALLAVIVGFYLVFFI
jgi:hypothetical protein